jgi:methyl-accepting chemotaxis protein
MTSASKQKKFTSIKVLFSLTFVLLFVLSGLVGGILIRDLHIMKVEVGDYIEETINANTLTSRLYETIGYGGIIHNFKNYVLRRDDKYYDRVVSGYEEFSAIIKELNALSLLDAEGRKEIKVISKTIGDYRSMADVVKTSKDKGSGIEELDGIVKISDTPALEAIKLLQDRLTIYSNMQKEVLQRQIITTVTMSAGMIGVILIISFLSLFFLYRRLAEELTYFARVSDDMAQGDLTKRVEIETNDFIGNLSRNFDHSIDNMAELLREMQSAAVENGRSNELLANEVSQSLNEADKINSRTEDSSRKLNELVHHIEAASSAVEEIGALAGNFAERTVSQAGAVDQTSSSVEQINASIANVTSITEKKLENTRLLVDITTQGNEQMSDTQSLTREISTSASVILEMIEVINNVASQTNLLSMNAAIEAAHAGESGKGFAVVADEIRKLAESTASNATQISGTLQKLLETVDKATESTNESSRAFSEIESHVKEVAESFQEIQSSMYELSRGSEEILGATNSLQQISSEIESGSREMKAGVGELNDSLISIKGFSDNTRQAMNEIEESAGSINRLTKDVSELSKRSDENLKSLQLKLDRFTLE